MVDDYLNNLLLRCDAQDAGLETPPITTDEIRTLVTALHDSQAVIVEATVALERLKQLAVSRAGKC